MLEMFTKEVGDSKNTIFRLQSIVIAKLRDSKRAAENAGEDEKCCSN